MTVDDQTLRTGGSYSIDPASTEYKVSGDVTLKLKRPTIGLAKELESVGDLTGITGTIEQVKVVAVTPDGWDWNAIPDDVDPGILARMVHDFLLLSSGIYRRPSSS